MNAAFGFWVGAALAAVVVSPQLGAIVAPLLAGDHVPFALRGVVQALESVWYYPLVGLAAGAAWQKVGRA